MCLLQHVRTYWALDLNGTDRYNESMRRLLALVLTLAVCSAQPAQAEPPKPQPHPSAKGKRITWVPYVWEREGPNWTLRCYVPTSGKRYCELIALG